MPNAGRIDLIQEIVSYDEKTRVAQFILTPDPRRYKKEERDQETLYVDKYLDIAFTLETLVGAFQPGLPGYYLSPSIESAVEYAGDRRGALEQELSDGQYIPPKEKAIASYELTATTTKSVGFLSVDICGSTVLRNKNAADFDRSYSIFLRELMTVVGHFNGSILKTTGDGFIAFIDHPSFTSLCDSIIDMGLSIKRILQTSINPALLKADLPTFCIRIGADYGAATVRQVSVPATGFSSTEVASDALNRSVKIQETCDANEFRIGRSLYELIHVQWLERAEGVEFDGASVGLPTYKVYRVQ